MSKAWSVSCLDASDRQRDMTVTVTENGVTLLLPPGESARFVYTGPLRTALGLAADNLHPGSPR